MKKADMVRMANQIATNLQSLGPTAAAAAVAEHIRAFWYPRMRAALMAHVEDGGEDLHPLVLQAAELLAPRPVA